MAIKRHKLFEKAKGSLMEKEDWWFFNHDEETGEQWVTHEWSHHNPYNSSEKPDSGKTQYSIDEFLKAGQAQPKEALKKLLDGQN